MQCGGHRGLQGCLEHLLPVGCRLGCSRGRLCSTWRRAVKIVQNRPLEGMRGGVCAGRLDKLLLHPLPEPHFLAIPNGVLDFRGPEMNPPTYSSGTLFFVFPNGVLAFAPFLLSPFAARSRANGPSKPLKTHFWVCAGYARPKGMAYPAKRFPPSGLEKHAYAKLVCARVCALYIYTLLCTLARGYARGFAHHIYMCFPEN